MLTSPCPAEVELAASFLDLALVIPQCGVCVHVPMFVPLLDLGRLALLSTRGNDHLCREQVGVSAASAHNEGTARRVVLRQRQHGASEASREDRRPRHEKHRLEGERLRRVRLNVTVPATDHENRAWQRDNGTRCACQGHRRSWQERHGVDVEDLRRGEVSRAVVPTDDEHATLPWH